MIQLYLDIDGVLLTKKQTRPAEGAVEFIHFILAHFDCFWLTTHCKGDASHAIRYLQQYFPEDICNQLEKIQTTHWDSLKTEAINFKKEFVWIDDEPFQSELNILRKAGREGSIFIVDHEASDALYKCMQHLQKLLIQ